MGVFYKSDNEVVALVWRRRSPLAGSGEKMFARSPSARHHLCWLARQLWKNSLISLLCVFFFLLLLLLRGTGQNQQPLILFLRLVTQVKSDVCAVVGSWLDFGSLIVLACKTPRIHASQ